MTRIKAVLLDRDGTIIHDRHYLSDPDGVELFAGAGAALAQLTQKGLRLFMVSNQSGINRGYFSAADADACNTRMAALLNDSGANMEDMVYCPHAPEESCQCRKPATGMWETLRNKHGLLPEETVMVGDKSEDMAFAANAKVKARILVLTGKGGDTVKKLGLADTLHEFSGKVTLVETRGDNLPDVVMPDLSFLPEAIKRIEEHF